MSAFDLIVILILAVSGFLGWYRGGVREIVVLAAIGGGFVLVHLFGASLSGLASGTGRRIAVLAVLFVTGNLIVGILGTYLVQRYLGAQKRRGDRAAGAVFGAVRGWVLAAFMVFTIEVYHVDTELPPAVRRSLLAQPLSATAAGLLRKADVTYTSLPFGNTAPMFPLADRNWT